MKSLLSNEFSIFFHPLPQFDKLTASPKEGKILKTKT